MTRYSYFGNHWYRAGELVLGLLEHPVYIDGAQQMRPRTTMTMNGGVYACNSFKCAIRFVKLKIINERTQQRKT